MTFLPRLGKIQVTIDWRTRKIRRLLALLLLLAIACRLLSRAGGRQRFPTVQLFPSEDSLDFVQVQRFVFDQCVRQLEGT